MDNNKNRTGADQPEGAGTRRGLGDLTLQEAMAAGITVDPERGALLDGVFQELLRHLDLSEADFSLLAAR